MKKFILIMALAASGRASIVGTTPMEITNAGCAGTVSGTLTYALNMNLTGTSSTSIDLSGTSGLLVTLTSTGASIVNAYFSNANAIYSSGALQMYQMQSPGSYCVQPKGRYVSFYNVGTKPTARVSAFYYAVVDSTGSVNLDPVSVDAALSLQSCFVSLSYTVRQVTTAGLAIAMHPFGTGPLQNIISTRDADGFLWATRPSATLAAASTYGNLTAVSVTATLDEQLSPRNYLHLFPAGSSTVNVFHEIRVPDPQGCIAATPTVTPTASPTFTVSPTVTITPTVTPTATPTP